MIRLDYITSLVLLGLILFTKQALMIIQAFSAHLFSLFLFIYLFLQIVTFHMHW